MDSADFVFFLELEEILHNSSSTLNILTLTEDQKSKILSSKLDYNIFRYDFDLNCRFICLFSRLERFRFSKVYIFLIKNIMILSSFLKNRTTPKVTQKNEVYLYSASENISNDFRISLLDLPEYVTVKMHDSAKLLIAFSLVNIHEVVGVTNSAPRNTRAFFFLNDENNLGPIEDSFFGYASNFGDFIELGNAMDETKDSSAFIKYSQQPRPSYRKGLENNNLISYGAYFSGFFVFLGVVCEYIFSKFRR